MYVHMSLEISIITLKKHFEFKESETSLLLSFSVLFVHIMTNIFDQPMGIRRQALRGRRWQAVVKQVQVGQQLLLLL